MSNYVENDYSEDYVEGDSEGSSSEPISCDLTVVMQELTAIKAQNVALNAQNEALNAKLDIVLSAIQSNNTLNLSINSKLVDIDTDIQNIPTSQLDISELVTKDYIASKVPFVDDRGLSVYPNGTQVMTEISHGVFEVVSSKFLPVDSHNFVVVYTLSKEINGELQYSDFASTYVVAVDLDEWILKTDCPSGG